MIQINEAAAQDTTFSGGCGEAPRLGCLNFVTSADWSVLLSIAWPDSISNRNNKTTHAVATIATIFVTIVKVLIRILVCASRFRTLPRLSEIRDLAAKF